MKRKELSTFTQDLVLLKQPTTDPKATDPPTYRPLTTYPPTTDPPAGYHELTIKQRPDSEHFLYSKVLENFGNNLFAELTKLVY